MVKINKKERIFYYDLLRTIAIIAVILCHVDVFFGSFNSDLKVLIIPAVHHIALIGVPIFLMISGSLLLNKEYTLSDFLKRRFSRIIYPFIFWMTIILLVGFLFFNWDGIRLWNTFAGNPGISWYFWMLIGIYLFLPVINSFLKEYSFKGLEYFLIIWFITIILKSIKMYPLFPDFDLNYFASYIGYPILGYYLDNKDFKINNLKIFKIAGLIFIISWSIYCVLGYYQIDLNPLYQNIFIVFMSIGAFLLIKYADTLNLFNKLKSNTFGKIIVYISVCSYGIYYAHFLVILFIEPLNIHSFKLVPLVTITIIFISWLLTYIFSKIPYLKKFSGV